MSDCPQWINEYGQEAKCAICRAPAEYHCNGCDTDVCATHVAFIYHDCPSLSGERPAGPSGAAQDREG